MNGRKPHDYTCLPALAGLGRIDQSFSSDWSVEQSVVRLKRMHHCLKRVHQILTSQITAQPIYELKTAFSLHAYICAEQVTLIRRRVSEMREPPLGLDKTPADGLALLMNEVECAPSTSELLIGIYEVVLPSIVNACKGLQTDAHPLADAPTIRVARLIEFELAPLIEFGTEAVACVTERDSQSCVEWADYLQSCLAATGGLNSADTNDGDHDAELPKPRYSVTPFQYQKEPQRDERFQDPFNAGVNPEAFLYDDQFSARDKTLMMYYKRIREIDVPEMMASILVELRDEEPWEFSMEMSRQLWDEARHAMMGEVGFAAQGIDWRTIPINFTWSRNLNLQLNARERHGVLFFIEQGLMPRTGKKYEWEVGMESGDPLSALFQDFDWADEVLHAQIGRRWYVPKFASLNEAMAYGDKCWSEVLSHWHQYKQDGLTSHRNWWPDVYRQACSNWGVEPDPAALAFNVTYEDSRADLKKL